MLKNLHVKNFQSHSATDLEFVPGINAIIGEPNSGKTALLRALNWVLLNRPLGDSYIRRGEKEARVQLVIDREGHLIGVTRIRGKTQNTYSLVDSKQDMEFTAFGNSPPPDVVDALNLSEINYQSQLAPYFLVFESPGAVAAHVRSVTGLEDIKRVSDVLTHKARSTQSTIKDRKEVLFELEEEMKVIEQIDLVQLETLIERSETLGDEQKQYQNQVQILSSILDQLIELKKEKISLPENQIQEITTAVSVLSDQYQKHSTYIASLSTLIDSIKEIERRISLPDDLDSLFSQHQTLHDQYQKHSTYIVSLLSLVDNIEEAQKRIPLPDDLDSLFSQHQTLQDQYNLLCQQMVNLHVIIENLSPVQEEGEKLYPQIFTLENEVIDLRGQLSVCPACGSMLTEETKKNLLEEVS